jgi:hydroxyethylthiazole kinase-like uncharacterized protein yjeF
MGVADRATIESGTPAVVLMDRAGRAVARAAIRVAGGRYGRRAVVACGPGSNGGDGFVAARILRREGMAVACLLIDDAPVEGAARSHFARLAGEGVAAEPFEPRRVEDADVIVDAIFGTGFRGTAKGVAATAIEAINASGAPVVAVDIPSGVAGATGHVQGPAVSAEVTVAIAAEKIGTALPPGALFAGDVEVVDIGIAVPESERGLWMTTDDDVAAVLPERRVDAHKRSNGSVAVLGGSSGMSGAPILACRGAVRMGAGYATLGTTSAVEAVMSGLLPEVLSMIVSDEDVLGPEALKRFDPVLERADVLVIGPGLGRGEPQRALVEESLAGLDLPIVLDADGLNVLADSTDTLARDAPTVITPHPGELAGLLGMSTAEVLDDRVDVAVRSAERWGCVVVLKGYRTIVAEPSGRGIVNPTGGPELATAGTGDVLSGAVAALLAAGVPAFSAAWAAVFVHGLAGSLAGTGAVAWDVAEALPDAADLVRLGTLPE